MWIGKLHDEAYVDRILQHVDSDEDAYGTSTRMRGMLTLARNVRDPLLPAIGTLAD